ncbi:coiled-coil-helix-coiled-coil-helix domain containing 3b isoform X2 [Silurus meridionalis]|nr:coiled-coil-helix-coiled-coil-helix domain containing 3b isoform X2 [Silurus meridionalis]
MPHSGGGRMGLGLMLEHQNGTRLQIITASDSLAFINIRFPNGRVCVCVCVCVRALIVMGGSSSSRNMSLESEDAEGVVLVKGIRMTDRVIDRMKESPSAQHPQSKCSTCPSVGQRLTPHSVTLAPTELLSPTLPHSPSYASALVPPPLQESISPLVSVSQKTPAPSTYTPTFEALPSATVTATESVPDSVLSVKEHVAIFPPTDSVDPVPTVEPLPINTSPLNFTEPVVLPLPAEPKPLVLSSSAEAVDISPSTVTDTMMSPPPSEIITTFIEATRMPLTDNVIIVPPVETTPLPKMVKPTDIPVESSVPSTHTLTLDTAISVDQVTLPTTPSSEPVVETEMLFSLKTALPAPIRSVEISPDMPPVKPRDLPSDLEELLPPPPSSALSEFCKVSSGFSPNEDHPAPSPAVEPAVAQLLPPLTESVGPATSPQAAVTDEVLRKQIREELQKVLKEEMRMAQLKIQQQFEEEKTKAKAEALAFAREQIQVEVQKVLEKEQLAIQQLLKDVITQGRQNIQDEQPANHYYIQKLKQKESYLAKQDTMYMEQLAKHEEKTAQITKVSAESFKKGLEETHKRFMRYQIKPVCSKLQSEILQCYLQHIGQTMKCSNIALQYTKCVNAAKQNKKVNTGG